MSDQQQQQQPPSGKRGAVDRAEPSESSSETPPLKKRLMDEMQQNQAKCNTKTQLEPKHQVAAVKPNNGSNMRVPPIDQKSLCTESLMKRKFHTGDGNVTVEPCEKQRKLNADHQQSKADEKFTRRAPIPAADHSYRRNPMSSSSQDIPTNLSDRIDPNSERERSSTIIERSVEGALSSLSNTDKDSTPHLSANQTPQTANLFLIGANRNEQVPFPTMGKMFKPADASQYRDSQSYGSLRAASPIVTSDEEEIDLYSGFINNNFYVNAKDSPLDNHTPPEGCHSGVKPSTQEIQELSKNVNSFGLKTGRSD